MFLIVFSNNTFSTIKIIIVDVAKRNMFCLFVCFLLFFIPFTDCKLPLKYLDVTLSYYFMLLVKPFAILKTACRKKIHTNECIVHD